MEINYDVIFILFCILCIMLLTINLIFYFYKKKGYTLKKIKMLIFIQLIIVFLIMILGLTFFIFKSSEEILNSSHNYYPQIVLFNISIFILIISIILFTFPVIEYKKNNLLLNPPSYRESRKGDIKIGRIIKNKSKRYPFFLGLKDLEKHMFICGATGTGKTNFLQNFLINFNKNYEIPFFLVEFKGEYHYLQKLIAEVLILWPGKNFSINIFNPENSDPKIHAERIFDILKSGQFLDEASSEFSPQMEKVLVEILVKVCKDKDLRSWNGFKNKCDEYIKINENKIPMLKQTLISIRNRIRRFSEGPLKALFEKKYEFKVKKLFEKNIILDLSSIIRLGGEKEDALFFLNMILKYLWDRNLTTGALDYKGIKHITIIEDAQYFAAKDLSKKNKLTTYLEDIALLQRGTGECLITLATRPDISKEILANNGIVITFKNHIERDIMCELLNLDIENKSYLSILEEGECLIRINSLKEPFTLWIPHIKREAIPISEIVKKNISIIKKRKEGTLQNQSLNGNSKDFTLLTKNILNEDLITEKKINDMNNNNVDFEDLKVYINKLYNLQEKKQ